MNFTSNNLQLDFTDIQGFDSNKNLLHNILMVVGNGFDISVLQHLGISGSTTYQSFFYYLKSIGFYSENALFHTMDELRKKSESEENTTGKYSNWCDFEAQLEDILIKRTYGIYQLGDDLAEIQAQFSKFLNQTVNSDVVNLLDTQVSEHNWSINTFTNFLMDLPKHEYEKTALPLTCNHFDIFNFDVVNLNFTPLLDCYLYLDRNPHEPKMKTVDRNFLFRRNGNNFPYSEEILRDLNADFPSRKFYGPDDKTGCSSYLITDVHHPHGQQDIPRSLLFGIDGEEFSDVDSDHKQFSKPYWAQLSRKFLPKIKSAQTFILFGTSLGHTDRWWWSHILESANEKKYSDIIIYKYDSTTPPDEKINDYRDSFIEEYLPEDLKKSPHVGQVFADLQRKTHVIHYSDPRSLNAFGFKEVDETSR